MKSGDLVVVYASAPTMAVVGAFVVAGVERGTPEALWDKHSDDFGIEEEAYRSYFAGAASCHAIAVGDVFEVDPVPLAELRQRIDGFRPPQSYQWWRRGLGDLLGQGASRVEAALLALGVEP